MRLFNASAWNKFHSIQLSGSIHQKMFLSRPFGNLGIGISASALSLESVLASALQNSWFCLQKLFFENRILMFFLVFSYGIGVHWCSRKRLSELSKAPVRGCFKKQLLQKFLNILHTFQWNIEGGVLFKCTCRPSLGFFQKDLKNSYSEENLLAPASVKRNFTAHVISGMFQNFKNMQGKARGCNLNNCTFLKGTPNCHSVNDITSKIIIINNNRLIKYESYREFNDYYNSN